MKTETVNGYPAYQLTECAWLGVAKMATSHWRVIGRDANADGSAGDWGGTIGPLHKTKTAAIRYAIEDYCGTGLYHGTSPCHPVTTAPEQPTSASLFTYRSPYRPMPLSYLPEEIEKSWSYDGSDIGAWTPQSRYAFTRKIPMGIVRQWDLEVVTA